MAVSIKPEDYIWERITETPKPTPTPTIQPAPPVPEPAPTPATPSLPKFIPSRTPVSADELLKNLENYYSEVRKIPNWEVLLEAENLAKKEARRLARREARRKAA